MSYQISTNANTYIFPDSSVFFLKKIHLHMHHTRTYSNPIAYSLWTKKTVQKFSCIKWTSILSQTFSLNLFFLLILVHSFMSLFIIYISSSCTYQYDTYDKCAMKMILILLDFHFLLKIEPMMRYDYFEWILFSCTWTFPLKTSKNSEFSILLLSKQKYANWGRGGGIFFSEWTGWKMANAISIEHKIK